jgi:glutaminyl-tRNA synthetase
VVKDDKGSISELHCSYDPESRGGWTKDGRKVLGTSHWVSAAHAVGAEVRLYDKLLSVANPAEEKEEKDFKEYLNPGSLEIVKNCKLEPGLAAAKQGELFQFLRQGYFCLDSDSSPEQLIFNRAVTLRDSWAKIERTLQDK